MYRGPGLVTRAWCGRVRRSDCPAAGDQAPWPSPVPPVLPRAQCSSYYFQTALAQVPVALLVSLETDAHFAVRVLLQVRRAGSAVVVLGVCWPMACGILVPQPGTEPAAPALQGRFITTRPPGKSPLSPLSTGSFSSLLLIPDLEASGCWVGEQGAAGVRL